ncbi:MAG: hypothetical protein ACWA5P_01885 [bacterium]
MPRIETFLRDDQVTDDDVFLGTDFADSNKTKNFKAFRLAEYVASKLDGSNLNDFVVQDIDLANAGYYYWGGLLTDGSWQINRYNKSNLIEKTIAVVSGNSNYEVYTDAWDNKEVLTYT